jgi:CHASE2 domain-containing sensor protein
MESRKSIFPIFIGLALAAFAFLIYQLGLMDGLELKSLVLRFQIRGAIAPQAPVVLVSIDQDSFDELNLSGPWPWTLHAALMRKLATSQAKIIAFDALFTEPKADPKEDLDAAPLSKELKKRWSYFIRKVYETDPLACPKCQGEMRIISLTTCGKSSMPRPEEIQR